MVDDPKLSLILERSGMGGKFELWACRGEGRGCKRNTYRSSKAHCDDCFGPLPEEMTIEQVLKRLQQGDA